MSAEVPLVLTVQEAAEILRVTPNTLRQLIRKDASRFPVVYVGRSVRIPREPFIRYIEEQRGGA